MVIRQHQACALCAAPATYAEFDYGHRKAIECTSCGQYVLTTNAERMLSQPPGQKEQQLAGLVKKTDSSEIVEIRTENSASGGKQLSAARIARSSLHLP